MAVTERQAAQAARQLLYHQRLYGWMVERMATNEATLERFLVERDSESEILPGAQVVKKRCGEIVVGAISLERGYEQLEFPVAEHIG